MNVFLKYTIRSLRKNRSRTLVTIIGIMLSTALITAVLEGAYSGIRCMIRYQEANTGTMNGLFTDLSEKDVETIRKDKEVMEVSAMRVTGFALIEAEPDSSKPYLCIGSADPSFAKMTGINVDTGRFPESSDELLIPEYLTLRSPDPITVGDKVTLSVGKTREDGQPLSLYSTFDYGNRTVGLLDGEERTYTVVGTYLYCNDILVPYITSSRLAVTVGENDGSFVAAVALKNPRRFYDWARNQSVSSNWQDNSILLRYYGVTPGGKVEWTVTALVFILLLLVVFGSILLVCNSFSISVTERTRQFGILRSVGATKKQLRGVIFSEAMLLSLIGIPLGLTLGFAGIGAVLWYLKDAVASMSAGNAVHPVYLRFEFSLPALLVSIGLGLLTTLASAWIPAIRANRVRPIEAVRQTKDIRISIREVKTPRIVGKIFGIEGILASKNYKRNRRQHRAVVWSLALSILLFVSAFSFIRYISRYIEDMSVNQPKVDLVKALDLNEVKDPEHLLERLKNASHVTKGAFSTGIGSSSMVNLFFSEEAAPDPPEGITYPDLSSHPDKHIPFSVGSGPEGVPPIYLSGGGEVLSPVNVAFLDDHTFRELLNENGISEEPFFDGTSLQGVLFNAGMTQYRVKGAEQNDVVYVPYSLIRESLLPLDCYVLQNVRSEEKSTVRIDLKIGAVIRKNAFCFTNVLPCLYYPYSMMDEVVPEEAGALPGEYSLLYYFNSDDRESSKADMNAILAEEGLPRRGFNEQSGYDRGLIQLVGVFSYGFILLISLIAVANAFNTAYTNVMLRRREFAMLRSIGLSKQGFLKMIVYEWMKESFTGLVIGFFAATAFTFAIWKVISQMIRRAFYMPWESIVISAGATFFVMTLSILYALRRVRTEHPVEVLKDENA
ncbi:MAG: ABC transporter permease [Lachnospiraceae bacterium]|nr:ABC transporter permease [Lachnospiraceae bacterium]